jgi:hypothetical protein
MYIDPTVAIVRYEEHVREAEQSIARLRALEERSEAATPGTPRRARGARALGRLLPRHGA